MGTMIRAKVQLMPAEVKDFFETKSCELGMKSEASDNLMDEISHKWQKHSRMFKSKANSRDLFWKKNEEKLMSEYEKMTFDKLITVTIDTSRLGEEAEALGLACEGDLNAEVTVFISP